MVSSAVGGLSSNAETGGKTTEGGGGPAGGAKCGNPLAEFFGTVAFLIRLYAHTSGPRAAMASCLSFSSGSGVMGRLGPGGGAC